MTAPASRTSASDRRPRSSRLAHASVLAGAVSLALMLATGAQAATVHKCTDANGRTTFSDQPCASGDQASEVTVKGQPLIGNPPPPAAEGQPGEEAKEDAKEEAAEEAPAEPDERAPRLRRMDHLLNQLLAGINGAGADCEQATGAINGWIERNGGEARGLYAAWDEIKYEKLLLKQKELEAMREKLRRQVATLRNQSLPTLNARCWNHKPLGEAFDRLQPYLPGN